MASEVVVNNVTPLPAPQHSPQTYAVRTSSILANAEQCKINMRAAELFASSDLVPNHYRGKPANCFIAINRAQRLGVDELYFFEKTYIVKGKLGMAAELAIELANSSGRFRGPIKFRLFGEGDARGCTAFATLASDGEVVENTVTYAMAVAEEWAKNSKWQTMRDQMLQYRAGAFLVRLYAGGSLGGMYMREELEDIPDKPAKAIGSSVPDQAQIASPGETIDNLLDMQHEPAIDVEKVKADVAEKLSAVKDLEALDDLWRGGMNARIREVGSIDKDAQKGMIAAFSAKKNEILKAQEADQEGVDLSDAIPAAAVEQEAPQKPAQADPAPVATKPRDQIDNALDALRKGDDEPPASGKTPAPIAIKVAKNEDGSLNWKAYLDANMAQLKTAYENEYGEAWLAQWLEINRPTMNDLRQANEAAEKKLIAGHDKAKAFFVRLREEAEAEALTEFPTIEVTYQDDSPDWPAFLRNLHGYLGDTPNHRVARAWWTRHSFQVGIIAKTDEVEPGVSGKAAAAEFKAALFARFPQLAE